MNRCIPIAVMLILPLLTFAQGENNQWCFGQLAGVDFNSGSPVATSSQISTMEGSSSIADASGNLLFYTDGITVWNKNHSIMPNGMGLFGGSSSTQSALIVQQPQTPNIYYVFTTPEAQGTSGFCYSIVDMTLAGGLGDVTTKNTLLFAASAEKVCATRHSNGNDVWVMGHEMGTNNFYAYLLTSAGLSAPVITPVGITYSWSSGVEIGYMKFSPNGALLCHAIRYLYTFELDSFNTTTGVVSAPILIPSVGVAYGVEFSPNGQLLYTSDSQVSQFDVSVYDAVTINASKFFVSSNVWALQMGPDKKIYIADYGSPSLSVINSPDVPGAGCNYAASAVTLSGNANLGLPNQLYSFSTTPTAMFSAPNHICPGTCTNFTNLSVNANSFQWTFNGATPSTSVDANPLNICYNTPGQYDVTLIATNGAGSDTLMLTNFITVYPQPLPQGISQSGDTLIANQGATSYQWYHDGVIIPGATDYNYVATEGGNYNVVATDVNGCEVEAVIFDVVASLQHFTSSYGIVVYPNPASDFVRIEGLSQITTLSIFDAVGKKVWSDENLNGKITIDLSRYSSGVYWLEGMSNNKITRIKLIRD